MATQIYKIWSEIWQSKTSKFLQLQDFLANISGMQQYTAERKMALQTMIIPMQTHKLH